MVGLVEALAHPTKQTQRLLEMALTWENREVPPPASSPAYRTMRQMMPAEVDELITGYKSGASVYDLADKFGIHRITVGKHLRAHGVDTKPSALTPAQRAEAADLYQAGWPLAKIGKLLNVSADTVRKYLIEKGVTMRRPWKG